MSVCIPKLSHSVIRGIIYLWFVLIPPPEELKIHLGRWLDASLTQCTWIRVSSRSWWWTGRPGMLQSMGSQRVGHDQATELNWTHSSVCTPPSTPQPATSGQHTLVVHPGKWITFTWYLTVLYFTVLFFKYASVFAQTKWPMLWVISHHKKVQKSFWLYQPRCCWVAKLCPTLCNPMGCSMPGSYVLHSLSWSLLKFMSIEVVMPSNLLILYHPLLFLLSIFPSIRVFSNESALHIR